MSGAKKTGQMTIGKLDAARRQLQTAITLWFNDGDPVSVHTLAFAAYEIIHSVSLKRNPNRPDLLFDSDWIKPEHQKEANDLLRKPANFFKHADRDGDSVISFHPKQSEAFFLFSIRGIYLCGERSNTEEDAWMMWLQIQKPHLLTDIGRERLEKSIPIDSLVTARSMSKKEFFAAYRDAVHVLATGKVPPSGPSGRIRTYPLNVDFK